MCFRKAVLTASSSQIEKESEGRLETGRPLIRERWQWLKWDRGSGDEGEEEDVTGVELMGQLDSLGRCQGHRLSRFLPGQKGRC